MGLQARPRLIQLRPSSRSASQHHPDDQLTSSKLRTELVWVNKTLLPASLISISKFPPDSLAQSINLILRVNYLEDLIQSEHGSSKSTSYHTLGAHMNPRAHPRPEGRRLHTGERPTMVIETMHPDTYAHCAQPTDPDAWFT